MFKRLLNFRAYERVKLSFLGFYTVESIAIHTVERAGLFFIGKALVSCIECRVKIQMV